MEDGGARYWETGLIQIVKQCHSSILTRVMIDQRDQHRMDDAVAALIREIDTAA